MKLKKAKDVIQKFSTYQGTQSAQRGNIGFTKLSSQKYSVYIVIHPYIMDIHNRYYAFPRAKVGMDLSVSRNQVQLLDPPEVLTKNYHHPFVHSSGRICYSSQKRWIDQGVRFKPPYPLNDKLSLARKISYALQQGSFSLKKGYRNSAIGPVHNLSDFQVIASNRHDAERYARSNGIPIERIIRNY